MAIRINGNVVQWDPATGRLTGPGTGAAAGKVLKAQEKAVAKGAKKVSDPGVAATTVFGGGGPTSLLFGGFGPPAGPGGFPKPPGSSSSGGDGFCGLLEGTARRLCEAGSSLVDSGRSSECPPGQINVPFLGCWGRRAAENGGATGTDGGGPMGGGRAVQGSFGMPAIEPTVETRTHRSCPDGMVLGKDNLCYPKAILSRRSRFRKWRQPRRPMFTAGDLNAIRRAERLKKKARSIGKDLGLKVTKR